MHWTTVTSSHWQKCQRNRLAWAHLLLSLKQPVLNLKVSGTDILRVLTNSLLWQTGTAIYIRFLSYGNTKEKYSLSGLLVIKFDSPHAVLLTTLMMTKTRNACMERLENKYMGNCTTFLKVRDVCLRLPLLETVSHTKVYELSCSEIWSQKARKNGVIAWLEWVGDSWKRMNRPANAATAHNLYYRCHLK